ncbi:accessory gland protein Acp62F-like [Belonocnema kinseyi]|uniref:accessory gland protein Acp62F-like n=1 Tax=Belonocnema kinseyi TaxID=2817044 RepID=UPI00143D2610|nr:accessory gland protein Acp62F-like [Belonocnema kinseyi]
MLAVYFLIISVAAIASGSPIDNYPPKQDCNSSKEIRVRCGAFCPATCSGKEAAQQCLAVCVPNVCECLPGYLRNDITWKCVLPCDCPKIKENDEK